MKHIAQLKSLEYLDLLETNIDDEGLAELTALPKLRFLYLSSPQLTVEGVKKLKQSKSLEYLRIDFTEEQILELAAAMPGVNIGRGEVYMRFMGYVDLLEQLHDPSFNGTFDPFQREDPGLPPGWGGGGGGIF